MRTTQVEIGSLIVHHPKRGNIPQGVTLRRMVEAHLQQLIIEGGAPSQSRLGGTLQLRAAGKNSDTHLAAAIAGELYRSIRGRD